MTRLFEEQRNGAIRMFMAAVAVYVVWLHEADKFMTRYVHTGTVCDHQRPGRPNNNNNNNDNNFYILGG